jgi:PPOX class probable F420-dependent enzyme
MLDSPALAHLVTLNPDGSPQVTVVWVGLDGDEIVAAHFPEHRKVRNIRNDSRVALSIETDTRNAMGLDEYLVVYGTTHITEGGAAELLQQLALYQLHLSQPPHGGRKATSTYSCYLRPARDRRIRLARRGASGGRWSRGGRAG